MKKYKYESKHKYCEITLSVLFIDCKNEILEAEADFTKTMQVKLRKTTNKNTEKDSISDKYNIFE